MTADNFARAVLACVRYREWTEFTPWFLAKGAQLKCSIVGYVPRHKRATMTLGGEKGKVR